MPTVDLTPKMAVKSAENELYINFVSGDRALGENIGGLQFFSNGFRRGYGNKVFGSSDEGIWLGAADYIDAPFKVSMAGELVATTAVITGMGKNFVSTLIWTATDIDTASWSAGTIKTNDGVSYSILAGNTGNILAPTYIYLNPAVSTTVLQTSTTATDAAGSGIILIAIVRAGAAGQESIIDVIGGVGTTIDGSKIVTGSIVATKLSVTTLSAISANLGTITAGSISGVTIAIGSGNDIFKADSNGIYLGNATFASAPFRVSMAGAVNASDITITGGTITGATIQTASSGQRVKMISNVAGGMGGLIWTDASGNLTTYMMYDTGDSKFHIGATGFTADGLITAANGIEIASGKNLTFLGTQGSINCGNIDCDSITTNGNQITCGRVVSNANNPQFGGHTMTFNSSATMGKNFEARFVSGRGCGIKMDDSGTNYTFEIQGSGASGFWINGTFKSAIVPTNKGYNALYCVEAPEVWFMDFTKEDRILDPMFDEVTTGECKWIKTEDGYQVWRRRKGHEQRRFETRSKEDFIRNERFLQTPIIN